MYATLRSRLAMARLSQITLVYGIGLALYLFTTIPHNWWVFLTVLMMTAAIEPGLVIQKSINRGKGTILGIILFMPLIYLLQLNYRMIPLTFILLACLLMVPNQRRYDLTVIFMTMMVFILNAYNFTTILLETPFQTSVNRIICTIIGIVVCIGGDYFLFRRFNYSRKLYYLLQRELCTTLEGKVERMLNSEMLGLNAYLVVEDLRNTLNGKFSEIVTSATSLNYDLRSDEILKYKIQHFDQIMWQMRRQIYAIYYCKFVKKDQIAATHHYQRFEESIIAAKNNFISYNNI